MNSLQGDEANIVVETPVNGMREFFINNNDGTGESYNYDKDTHRMYYEFVEFIRIIDEQDMDKACEMLEISSIASELMEKARKTGGIVFEADKKA